jgi:hypothetical protein
MGVRWAVWLTLGAATACGGSDALEVDRSTCEHLRAHVVDLRLADLGKLDVDVAAHRTAIQNALGEGFVLSCMQTIDVTQMKCALGAADSASASACLGR